MRPKAINMKSLISVKPLFFNPVEIQSVDKTVAKTAAAGLHSQMAAALLGAALLMSSASMAQDNDPLSQYADDPATTSKVKAALIGDQMLSALDIQVQSDDLGAVHLSGTARSPAEVSHATSVARGVSGVVSVQNDIIVESKTKPNERKPEARQE